MADVLIFFLKAKELQNDSVNTDNIEAVKAITDEIGKKIKFFKEKKEDLLIQVITDPETKSDGKSVLKWKEEAYNDSFRFFIELLEELLENISDMLNESSNTNSIDTTLIFNKQKDVLLKRLTEFLITRYKIYKNHKKDVDREKNRQAQAGKKMLELVKELLDGVNQ